MSEINETLISKVAEFTIGGGIDGDYFEFGVFNGNSLIHAYFAYKSAYESIVRRYGFVMNPDAKLWVDERWRKMRFWGFDSFEGLPEVTGVDQGGAFKKGDYTCPLKEVEKKLKKANIDEKRVNLVKGWFKNSFDHSFVQSLGGRKAAVIHIDCDLYESTRDVMDLIFPLLTDGTVIIFDDWFQFRGHPEKGERKAFQEFLAKHPKIHATEYHKEGVWRNSFILNFRPN